VSGQSQDCHVAVVGAGPYGLSAAAYLRAAGVETRVFGQPMAFWQNQMPAGMCLRSNWGASHIADPPSALTLDEYCRQNCAPVSKPIPLQHFIDYGRWYQRHAVPDLDERAVCSVEIEARGFKLLLEDGREVTNTMTFGSLAASAWPSSAPGRAPLSQPRFSKRPGLSSR
jgi:cation diffusion facilitator CzcD-associated flavoprotein CzcO